MKYAEDDCKYTDEQVRRVAVVAFEEARKRKTPLINIHKANVSATSRFAEDKNLWGDDGVLFRVPVPRIQK